jgi:uncharacterized repeat protein (TIGR03803 family)
MQGRIIVAAAFIGLWFSSEAATGGVEFEVLHTFDGVNGGFPSALIVVDSALYGTTGADGAVFSLGLNGSDFHLIRNGIEVGSNALTALGRTVYGTTTNGGTNHDGTVFSFDLDSEDFQVLHTFTEANGKHPIAGLTLVGSTLYGTTLFGGTDNRGTVFSIGLDGTSFQVLHSFGGLDGRNPFSGLTTVGTFLFGTTRSGGDNGRGTVYSLDLDGSNFQVIHSFGDGIDVAGPFAGLTAIGSTLYGTTSFGGTYGTGTIYSLGADGLGFEVLHSFAGDAQPSSAGMIAIGSMLYGTASWGGANNLGFIFSLGIDGSDYEVLHSFSLSDGRNPSFAGLSVVGTTLYGTLPYGGTSDFGTVFALAIPEASTMLLGCLGAFGVVAILRRGQRAV